MAECIHEFSEWPKFRCDEARLAAALAAARDLQGRFVGQMEALGFKVREEAVLRTLTEDVLQVVSGPVGRERVHFEAPAAQRLEAQMRRFLDWFNAVAVMELVLKAALAHLWFVTIHPLDDGNGRIARAMADMSLARSEGSSQRFYSMSAQTREEPGKYYDILERTQKRTLDVTASMEWFLACLTRTIKRAQAALSVVVDKVRYWEKLRDVPLNERQRLVINRLLEGFEGKLTSSKWAALTKSSSDTALRDIQRLVERGVLVRNHAGGRSTSYSLAAL